MSKGSSSFASSCETINRYKDPKLAHDCVSWAGFFVGFVAFQTAFFKLFFLLVKWSRALVRLIMAAMVIATSGEYLFMAGAMCSTMYMGTFLKFLESMSPLLGQWAVALTASFGKKKMLNHFSFKSFCYFCLIWFDFHCYFLCYEWIQWKWFFIFYFLGWILLLHFIICW